MTSSGFHRLGSPPIKRRPAGLINPYFGNAAADFHFARTVDSPRRLG
jgi:hypothetical protein